MEEKLVIKIVSINSEYSFFELSGRLNILNLFKNNFCVGQKFEIGRFIFTINEITFTIFETKSVVVNTLDENDIIATEHLELWCDCSNDSFHYDSFDSQQLKQFLE